MTTRLMKTQKTKKPPVVQLLCPACRAVRRCKPVGVATIGKRRRELVQCASEDCQLIWAPERRHLPPDTATAPKAA